MYLVFRLFINLGKCIVPFEVLETEATRETKRIS